MIANAIFDTTGYGNEMRKALFDKLFFLDKVDSKVFVDYGCYDGSLIEEMYRIFPDRVYIGYDNNPQALKLAREKCPYATFYSDWKDVQDYISRLRYLDKSPSACLILSSVIHEIYSYADPHQFWGDVTFGFKEIVIRDMAMSIADYGLTDPNDYDKVALHFRKDNLSNSSRWGDISLKHNFVHYLLKYRYEKNWAREVNENYLPLTVEGILDKFRRYNPKYKPYYMEHFTLPFLRDTVEKDFGGLDLKIKTHIKLIMK